LFIQLIEAFAAWERFDNDAIHHLTGGAHGARNKTF
jgi:hypothetical protein